MYNDDLFFNLFQTLKILPTSPAETKLRHSTWLYELTVSQQATCRANNTSFY